MLIPFLEFVLCFWLRHSFIRNKSFNHHRQVNRHFGTISQPASVLRSWKMKCSASPAFGDCFRSGDGHQTLRLMHVLRFLIEIIVFNSFFNSGHKQ